MAIGLSSLVGNGALGSLGGFLGGAVLSGLFGRKKKSKASGLQALDSWIQQLLPMAQSDLDFMRSVQPDRQRALIQLARQLDPGSSMGRIEAFRQSAQNDALDAARRASWSIGQGRNRAMQDALMLDAWNRASGAGNAYAAQQHSPESLAAAYAAMAQALSPQSLSGSVGMATDLIAALQRATPRTTGGSSFLDTLLPIFGQLAPYLDWKSIKL